MTTTIKPSQLRDLLALTIPAREPVLITGKPGIGKTDSVDQACERALADLIVSHPVVNDPTDYKGLPWIKDGNATFLPFGDLQKLISAKKLTVYFLDDLGQATPAVQAAAMQLLLARQINGHKVSPHVVFVAATNRRTDRAGVSGILEPVKSRFATIVELEADVNDWCMWAAASGIAPEVIAYVKFRPDQLSNFQPSADMVNSPSPRTWAAVSRLLALNLPRSLQVPAFEGAIGHATAVEFVGFLRIFADMVSPDLILTSPDTAPIPSEPSALWAVSTAIAARVAPASMPRFCRYLERVQKEGRAEFAALSMQAATARDAKLTSTAAYVKAMAGPLGQLMIGEQS
jgi:ATPase family associated with various cellular activities (AAA)